MLQPENLLKSHHLRQTDCRTDVLLTISEQDKALSHAELEHVFAEKYDRVTLYRTIKTFVEAGLLHKVLDEGGTKYALCSHQCQTKHQHNHVHFKCTACGETKCLDQLSIPKLKLPTGYQLSEINYLAEGLCPKCG